MEVPFRTSPNTKRPVPVQDFVRQSSTAAEQSGASLAAATVQIANTIGTVGGLMKQQASAAMRMGVLQSFSEFNTQVDQRLVELQQNADPRLGNYAEIATANYDKWEQEWLKTVPDEFHDEFAVRSAQSRENVARQSLAFQYENTDNYFRQGIIDQLDRSKLALDQDGSIANLDSQRAAVDEYIDSTTLTEAEKVAKRREAYRQLESISYATEVRRGNIEAGALGVGTGAGTAVDLILEFDGASMENGLDYGTNRELLTERVREAEVGAATEVGEVWAELPDNVQAVLTSIHDDLGELPNGVIDAVKNGDLTQLVGEIRALGGERRELEASIAEGNAELPAGMLDADPRFANIPYEDRLALRRDAEMRLASELEADRKAQAAAEEAQRNALMVGIMDGTAGQYHIDEAREMGWLADYDDIKKAQDALDKKAADVNSSLIMQQHVQMGIPINPGSEDDRNMFNAYIGAEGIDALRQRNADYVTQVVVPAVRSAGDLPTETVGLLTGMMRAQDPQMALFALDTLSQLEQASPEAYQARVSPEVAGDVEYWRSVKDYYPQQEVLNSIRGGTTQEERTRTTMLRQEARDLLGEQPLFGDVVSQLGDLPGWRWGDPTLTPGATAMLEVDFNGLFEREFARDGNLEAAKGRAVKALGRVWNTTDIGGQQTLMRYPPELIGYETWNGSHEWITEQGRADLGLEPGQNFQLISDEQTKAEYQAYQPGGARPSYLAVYSDAEGNLRQALDENGMPKRIFFEITDEMNAEKLTQFEAKQEQLAYDTAVRTYEDARKLWRRTGTPIPPEIQEAYDAAVEAKGPPRNTMMVFQGWGQ